MVQESEGEILVYDLTRHKAFFLNTTSAAVWEACDRCNDLSDIGEYAAAKLKTTISDDLIILALDQLYREGLIGPPPTLRRYSGGVSRRDAVRKMGALAVVAVPVVATMVVPEAASAASTCGSRCFLNNAFCTNPSCPICTAVGEDSMCTA